MSSTYRGDIVVMIYLVLKVDICITFKAIFKIVVVLKCQVKQIIKADTIWGRKRLLREPCFQKRSV
jgi:hypothetical protein